jgi:hypothetical protein
MSDTVLKRLNVADVFTIPYEANKLWSIPSSSFTDDGIFFQIGTYTDSQVKTSYTDSDLLYKSVLANYYPTFYPTFSHSTASYSQTIYWTTNLSTSSYSGFQNIGNQATTEKYFPTTSGSFIYTLNIPSSLYSNKIVPTTFKMQISGGLIYDDGEYNLRYSGSNQTSSINTIISQSSYVGNLFYEQGLGVLTVIPNSIIPTSSTPPTPPPSASYEWTVIWMENTGTGGTPIWGGTYSFVNGSNVSQSISLGQGTNSNLLGALFYQKVGTGTWTITTGTPITFQKQAHVDQNPVPADAKFIFPGGSTGVVAVLGDSTVVPYSSPLPSPTNVYGYAVLGNTAGDGIQYLGV